MQSHDQNSTLSLNITTFRRNNKSVNKFKVNVVHVVHQASAKRRFVVPFSTLNTFSSYVLFLFFFWGGGGGRPPQPPHPWLCACPVIDRQRVYKRLCGISTDKACHPNDPPSRQSKEFAYELFEPLTTLFNLCLSQGCFPDIWKHASISAIPKTNPVTSYDQLRPNSITPT